MMSYLNPDYAHAALVIVDFQNDCLRLDGPFHIPGTNEALPALASLAAAVRASGRPVVHILRGYLPDGSNADLCRRNDLKNGLVLFHVKSEGADFPSALKPEGAPPLDWEALLNGEVQALGAHDYAIHKPRWGAFYRTPLEDFLREHGITTLIIAGCNYPNCPRTTIYEASERDFRLVLAQDAMSRLDARGLEEMANIGVTLATVDEILHAL